MKNRKIILGVLLMVMTTVPVFAQQYNAESDFKTWPSGRRNGGVQITGYVGDKSDVRIPPIIQNIPVTEIRKGAFKKEQNITSIAIPDSVLVIDRDTFSDFTSLISVNIPNSLTSVAFAGTILSFESYNDNDDAFPGDLIGKFYAINKEYGTPGTYTRKSGESTEWTKQQ